jgi:hypothetical protein
VYLLASQQKVRAKHWHQLLSRSQARPLPSRLAAAAPGGCGGSCCCCLLLLLLLPGVARVCMCLPPSPAGAELDSGTAAQQAEGGAEAVSASGRPRRTVKAPERLIDTLKERGPYDMVRCGTYSGRPGSGAGGSQPFQVLVSPW